MNEIVFHGTDVVFDKFDNDFINYHNYSELGFGFYFDTNKSNAEGYGKYLIKAKITYKKPFKVSEKTYNWMAKHWGYPQVKNFEIEDFINLMEEDKESKTFWLQAHGYDVIIYDTQRVVFDPEQISILEKETLTESEELNDNFKKWFKNSKVVDSNKQPKIVYHGSPKKDIEIFEPKRGFIIDGIYFSDNISVAAHWSGDADVKRMGKVKDADTVEELLQILNTYTKAEIVGYDLIGDDKGTFYRLETYGGDVSSSLGYKVDEDNYEYTLNNGKVIRKNIKELLREEIRKFADSANNSGNYACYLSIQKPLIVNAKKKPYHSIDFNGIEVNTEYLVKYAKENGYDGVIVKNVLETDYENKLCTDYIVFNANQIKSVDNNGKWSTTSDNIYENEIIQFKKLNEEIENILNEVIAYAGSGIDYDKPSYKVIGLGEGHAAHGWGFYYAVDYDVADSYRLEAITGETLRFFGKDYTITDIRGFNDRFIDHGDLGLDIVLQYCYDSIKRKKSLNVEEILEKLNRRIKYISNELDNSSRIKDAKNELEKINKELINFVPDKKLKELQKTLEIWKSEDILKVLDSDTVKRAIEQTEKDIRQEEINIENEFELNQLKELKARWQDTLGTLENNTAYKDVQSINNMIKFINNNKIRFNDYNIFMIGSNEGIVKKVNLPDGPYIEESLTLKEQSLEVRKALYNICSKLGLDDGEMIDVLGKTGKSAYFGLCELIRDKYGYFYKMKGTGKRADKIVSRLLNKEGIKGIHYFGEEDGECYVVFNQLDIKPLKEDKLKRIL